MQVPRGASWKEKRVAYAPHAAHSLNAFARHRGRTHTQNFDTLGPRIRRELKHSVTIVATWGCLS